MTDPIIIDPALVQTLVEQAIEKNILGTIENLCQDEAWLNRIEHMINQAVTLETIAKIGSVDLNSMIRQQVSESMSSVKQQLVTELFQKYLTNIGINDRATACKLTIMDDTTVVENLLTAENLTVVNGATIRDLAVTGSINTDNQAWITLAENISNTTLDKLSEKWRSELVQQVAEQIREKGIEFDTVTIGGNSLIQGNRLSNTITESNLQSVGLLNQLSVKGPAHINNTLSVVNLRLGINTDSPEAALSVWDEEVSVIVGKHKAKQAYIGTGRDQTLSLGVNRTPYLDIDNTGLTTVKKLQVGVHKFSHATQVPGWLGTKGDIVFNANPGPDRVFAWVCTGSYNWQIIKGAE